MERHYDLKKEYLKSESPIRQNYEKESPQGDEENLFKEIYSNMRLFANMLHEVRQTIKLNPKR